MLDAPQAGMVFRNSFFAPVVYFATALAAVAVVAAAGAADASPELKALQQRNTTLEALVHQQQSVIENLNRRVDAIEKSEGKRDAAGESETPPARSASGFNLGKVNLSGEGGVAFFHTGSEGAFPNSEFRVDEAKLFVEAPVWDDVYFFCELKLATRENDDLGLRLGKLYLDFENVSKRWGRDRMLNVRLGRFDIPFGEEYLTRDAILNPLISRSLSDLWGVDEGVELYGSVGKFSYVVAVQNGGESGTRDFNPDKAVVGRVAYDPTPWLHLSVSGMRTGDLDAINDYVSALWIGNGWFRSIGGMNTTLFHANLVEGDVAVRWNSGHLKAFGGAICYGDNDPDANNGRSAYYYSVEAVQHLTGKLYGAARFSQILAEKGLPLIGHGNFDDYFYGPLATELHSLSLGLGYRFSEHLLLKVEYTLEGGKEVGGGQRNREDFFAAEAAFKF